MSYWTFTDIFEENGPVPSPFHGGFGLLNFEGLRKPAFYAYQFLNRLGDIELTSSDSDSWACRDPHGVQILFWNFTPPITTESDQKLFKRDLPPRDFGEVKVSVARLPAGSYQAKVYQVGYHVNDVYDSYLQMGSPTALQLSQIQRLREGNDGRPGDTARVQIGAGQAFTRNFSLRETDCNLFTLRNY